MSYSIKKFWLVLMLLLAGAPSMFGYSFLGPYESWQTTDLGFAEVGDDGGPKDIGDFFRWNTRTVFYACDESFSDYFGSNGVAAVESAFLVFNNLTNLSSYSPGLTEWPLQTSRINFTAEAVDMVDLKSMTMSKIINMLGLGQADRYVWNIHNRFIPSGGGTCPTGEVYVVVQRNYDPVTQVYSSYINGTLYDYAIGDVCTAVRPPVAIAQPIAVDLKAPQFLTVADGTDAEYNHEITWPGRFFTGLTRDDVGGLRYLMASNRYSFENVSTNVLMETTNNPQLIVTSNLNLFYAQALTNTPAAFQAIYPDLIITSTNETFTNVVTTNITAVATNVVGVAGSVVLVLVTNFTTNVQPIFSYTFANLVVYTNFPQSFVTTQTTQVTPVKGSLAGTVQTNTSSSTVLVNATNGAFYIIPATLCGGYTNIVPQLTNVVSITNIIPILNPLGLTNTNAVNASIVTYFTNYFLVASGVQCVTNGPEVFEGLDKINFQEVKFDSTLGTNWGPVTNVFQLTAVTNFTPVVQTFRRVVTRPDILIEAKDGILGPSIETYILDQFPASLNYNASAESSDGNGPGTIEPPIAFLYTKGSGPSLVNGPGVTNYQGNAVPFFFVWGSFDGSTNTPVLYPSTSSMAGLQSLILFQISTFVQLSYSVSQNSPGNPFNVQLQANGGAQPYKWTLAPGSPTLPAGLTLSQGGVISGVASNVSAGTIYDFEVQATDSSAPTNRVTQAAMFITITQ